MHAKQQGKEERHDSILSLYERTWEEIERLREFQWKIAATFITINGGLIALLCSNELKPLLTPKLRWWLTVGQCFATVFGAYCLITTHRFLRQQRNIRRRIEEVLGFYDKSIFTDEPLLPEHWKGKRVTLGFQAFDLLLPLIAIVLIVQGLSLYFTWTIE